MDLNKIHKDHRKAYTEVRVSQFLLPHQQDQLYKIYTELNKTPKKDWDKTATKEKLKRITQ